MVPATGQHHGSRTVPETLRRSTGRAAKEDEKVGSYSDEESSANGAHLKTGAAKVIDSMSRLVRIKGFFLKRRCRLSLKAR